MDNIAVPRLLTDADMTELRQIKAREREIYTAAGWFLPLDEATTRAMSEVGPKTANYVDESESDVEQNASMFDGLIDVSTFKDDHAVYEQAEELENLTLENLVAPHNTSLVAGAASKKLADTAYNLFKGFARINSKFKAIAESLSARYKNNGPKGPVAAKGN